MKKIILAMMAVLICIVITMPAESATEDYFGAGIDCSGGPFWAVNTVLDTDTYAKSPIPEGAHKQYLACHQEDLKITKIKGVFETEGLKSVDLIFIDTTRKGKLKFNEKGKLLSGQVDHVLVYLGDGKVWHAVDSDKKVVVETLKSALDRKVKGGETYFELRAGCGRITELTDVQREEVVKLLNSIKGAPYQFGAKGWDFERSKFVTIKEIKGEEKNGYTWNHAWEELKEK
ncbi:MAG: hypothetical protein IMF19_14700, partial [Proteobacteria bacterium]|nr:hypothetical protein [Pseudomonadota bacterium]